MNRTMAIAIGVIFLIGVVGVAVAIPLLLPTDDMSITVTFYDEDDNVVFTDSSEAGLWEFAFKEAESGAIVEYLIVTTSYTVTADAPNSVVVVEQLTITSYVTFDDGVSDPELKEVNELLRPSPVRYTMTGERKLTVTMDELIPDPDMSGGKTYGWSISFDVDWTATATWAGQDPVTATDDAGVAFGIGWSESAKTMSIIGTISKG